jgi:hypothetical protein
MLKISLVEVFSEKDLGILKKITSQYASLFCDMPRRQNP